VTESRAVHEVLEAILAGSLLADVLDVIDAAVERADRVVHAIVLLAFLGSELAILTLGRLDDRPKLADGPRALLLQRNDVIHIYVIAPRFRPTPP
jgi:hypothetical protein